MKRKYILKCIILAVFFIAIFAINASASPSSNKKAIQQLYKKAIKKYGDSETNKKAYNKWCAHRGYSALAPENTEPAFILAGMLGAVGIEADVRPSKEGLPYIMHDSSLVRMTGIDKKVSDCTAQELNRIRIKSGKNIKKFKNLKICTFQRYLEICREYGCNAVVHIKNIYDKNLKITLLNNVYREIKLAGMIKKCEIRFSDTSMLAAYRIIDKGYLPVVINGRINFNATENNEYEFIDYDDSVTVKKTKCSDEPLKKLNRKKKSKSFSGKK